MKVTALAGGVGGAKLLVGFQRVLPPGDLTAIVNTGDDTVMYGVHVSPDVDICCYWLAGIADKSRGWGVLGDTFRVVGALDRLGRASWFSLGDIDFATCLYRTEKLTDGVPLSEVTDDIRQALGIASRVLPMSDEPVRTHVVTSDGRTLDFQQYFVKERTEPDVSGVSLNGIEEARPAPGVLDAIEQAERVVVCPSNPIVSIGPILALPGVRDALRAHPHVSAVSPIIRGAALKGPADRLLRSLGQRSSAAGVAQLYADFCDDFVLDASEDPGELEKVEALGPRGVVADTFMVDEDASARLAGVLLASNR